VIPPAASLRIPLAFLRGSAARLVLTASALAAGVALVCAVDLVNRSVLRAFVEIVDTMAGRAALQVTAGRGALFPETTAELVGQVPGVELAVPVVSATAFMADGTGEALTIQGVDITNDAMVRVYDARDERERPIDDPLLFLNKPDSVILTRELARRRGLVEGDAIILETPTGRRSFTVRGLLEPVGVARVYGGNLAVMDLFAAEAAFTEPELINRVDVVVARDHEVPRVAADIAAALPSGLRVERPVQRQADLHDVMRSLQVALQAVGMLALAAAFLIAFNRMAAVYDARAWQLGVMRAAGVRRGALWWELVKESLLVGAVGVAVGIPAGIALGRLILPVVATTTALSSKLVAPAAELLLSPFSAALAGTLGLATALAAAARPAWRAARLDVVETLRSAGIEPVGPRGTCPWVWCAAVAAAAGIAAAVHVLGASPPWGLVATAGLLVGGALLARPLLEGSSALVLAGARRVAATTLFAVAGLARRPGRAALTVATLGVGFGTVVWIWVVAASFERSVIQATRVVLRGDLAISSVNLAAGFVEAPMDESILDEVRAVPGVGAVVGSHMIDWHYGGGPIAVGAFDAAYVNSGAFGVWPLVGRSLGDVWEGFSAGRTALVSTNFVFHLGKGVGDSLTLETPSGPLTLEIGGVTSGLASPRGTVIISRETYKRYWRDPQIVHALVRAGGADTAALRAALAARLGARHSLKILSLGEYASWLAGQVRRAFAAVYVLGGVVLLVVLFGAADTLAAGVLERRREIGVMRAVGVRRRALRRIVLTEAVVLGVLGMVLAVALGLALGVFWVHSTFPRLLGWVLDLHVPAGQLAAIGVASLGVCLVAAVVPARHAGRLAPAAALRHE
jgi:putative ABC transport system permease protein